jgi:hypothetical protein
VRLQWAVHILMLDTFYAHTRLLPSPRKHACSFILFEVIPDSSVSFSFPLKLLETRCSIAPFGSSVLNSHRKSPLEEMCCALNH